MNGGVPPINVKPDAAKLARTGLTLALLGMACMGPIAGIPAVWCCHRAKRLAGGDPASRAYQDASSGLLLGYLSILLFSIGLVLLWFLIPIVYRLFHLDRFF